MTQPCHGPEDPRDRAARRLRPGQRAREARRGPSPRWGGLLALFLTAALGLPGAAMQAQAQTGAQVGEPSAVQAAESASAPASAAEAAAAAAVAQPPASDTQARSAAPALRVTALAVKAASTPQPDLLCPRAPPRPPPPPGTPEPAPTQVPDADDVEAALAEAGTAAAAVVAPAAAPSTLPPLPRNGDAYRVAFWGDSHIAAAFFTDELARILSATGAAAGPPRARFVAAGVGHGGVRSLVRKACLSPGWSRESAHARPAAAEAPGPGLVSLLASEPGTTLTLDLRDAAGQATLRTLQLLWGPQAQPATLAIAVDDQPEQTVELGAESGPAALELQADAAVSLLRLRLVQGSLRLQGLRLGEAAPARGLQWDVFGYPGATVAGWARADTLLLRPWFDATGYDLVVLAYGTNEANDSRYTAAAYRETLLRAVGQARQLFPQARCLLLGPGDRGVRVALRPRGAAKGTPKGSAKAQPRPRADLLKYARLHEEINRVQREVAAQMGCSAWDAQQRMGGRGAAYRWARAKPALMAQDLIHFTPAGYRELAQGLAADLGWGGR